MPQYEVREYQESHDSVMEWHVNNPDGDIVVECKDLVSAEIACNGLNMRDELLKALDQMFEMFSDYVSDWQDDSEGHAIFQECVDVAAKARVVS